MAMATRPPLAPLSAGDRAWRRFVAANFTDSPPLREAVEQHRDLNKACHAHGSGRACQYNTCAQCQPKEASC